MKHLMLAISILPVYTLKTMPSEKQKDKIIIALLVVVGLLLVYLIAGQKNSADTTELEKLRAEISAVKNQQQRGDSADPYEKNEVKNTILKGAADKIQVCFKTWFAKNPQFQTGRVGVDWEIQTDGLPTKVEIVSSEVPEINDCIKNSIQALKFPPPPGGSARYIAHKFFFKREEK